MSLMFEKEIDFKKQELAELKQEMNSVRESIQEISNEISRKCNELNSLKEMLLQYYHNILEVGKDFR